MKNEKEEDTCEENFDILKPERPMRNPETGDVELPEGFTRDKCGLKGNKLSGG